MTRIAWRLRKRSALISKGGTGAGRDSIQMWHIDTAHPKIGLSRWRELENVKSHLEARDFGWWNCGRTKWNSQKTSAPHICDYIVPILRAFN